MGDVSISLLKTVTLKIQSQERREGGAEVTCSLWLGGLAAMRGLHIDKLVVKGVVQDAPAEDVSLLSGAHIEVQNLLARPAEEQQLDRVTVNRLGRLLEQDLDQLVEVTL